ncbi:hypothetical protein JVX98_27150 [Ensifer sp. PDNC004]|uniref:hypothetical protein n=1 Tax=Ensifer sp. PDNC004 TaxID=2811423 RepID=UPI00196493AE|nr:hypothetical protein [Ensifer sp. PDNC004]QRY67978.1 hypothetical protein JVX98_27150 [Ensifer sp. PDNC004]
MSNKRFEMEKLARQFFRDNKKVIGLIADRGADTGFEPAVRRLFGDNPTRGKSIRIGNRWFVYTGLKKNLVSFLPMRWHEELDKGRVTWPGCQNWWAGYPLIAWVEVRASDDGSNGHLKLNAEVGPISHHRARKGIIEVIAAAADAKALERVHFPVGAADEGRLYSRFLRGNSTPVNDIRDTDEIEGKFVRLVADFETEFELIATLIPQFVRFDDTM